jgi:hypothetical protein
MEPKLPQLFTLLPKSPVTVEAIPPFQAAAATHYVTGTPDGKRPGRVVVATSNFAERSLIDDEAVAYHEGVPGHHMQNSVNQQLTGLPKFRLHGLGFNAYGEGWALYAEQLGKEVGFYQDPVSDYGRLSSELFRAVRLVVDTGIHSKGWTRQQVVEFMRKSGAVAFGKLETRLKTPSASRQVNIYPEVAKLLRAFIGTRTTGLLFQTKTGKPLSLTNILRRHLHQALKKLGYINPNTGDHQAGSHAFRRFRNTYLKNETACPKGLRDYWLGHAGNSMDDLYDVVKENTALRKKKAEEYGIGFELPSALSFVPNVPKKQRKLKQSNAA